MKNWIRIPGLVAFVIFTALIFVAIWLYSGTWVKSSIENQGSQIHGAQIDVDDASVSLVPFKVTLKAMQITNPDQPMENVMEFETAEIHVNVIEALFGKLIIENVELTGLQFNTERTKSGAIEQKAKSEQAQQTGETVNFGEQTQTNIQDIFAQETLKTIEEAKKTQAFYTNAKDQFATQWQTLPSEQDFADYQAQYQAFEQVEINSLENAEKLTSDLAELKLKVLEDKQSLNEFKSSIAQFTKDAAAQNKALLAAPAQDWTYLSEKYALNQSGLVNATSLIFGDQYAGYLEQGLEYYEMAKPWIARFIGGPSEDSSGQSVVVGRTIHFAQQGLPAFLLKQAQVSALLSSGEYGIAINEVTSDQSVRGLPTTITATGDKLKTMTSSAFNFEYDQGTWLATLENLGMQQKAKSLLSSEDLSLNMAVDAQDMQLNLGKTDGEWQGNWRNQYQDVNWQNQAKGGFNQELANALNGISNFNFSATFSGTGLVPNIAFESDLDSQLSAVFKKRLKEEQAKLEAKIKARVNEEKDKALAELGPYQQSAEQYLGDFDLVNGRFAEQVEAKQKALEQKIADYKNAALDKAQAEADAIKAKAEEEKRKAEAAAKKKAEEEAKKKLNNLKLF